MHKLSLANKSILVTRAAHQFEATAALIRQQHATAISFPCLELHIDKDAIQTALAQVQEFSDILFTSSNAVEALASTSTLPLAQMLHSHRIAAVGQKTALALQKHHVHVDIIAGLASQSGLIQAYQQHGLPQSLMFFRAEQGSDQLSHFLQSQHRIVNTVKAYRSTCPSSSAQHIIDMLKNRRIDAVLLASAKTVEHYVHRIQNLEIANQTINVAMSKQVAGKADKLGLKVQLTAIEYSFASMLDVLSDHFDPWSHP
ncbi:MAG: uroporphyrinogen-III synthase [Mariprofundaceae bacterium]